MPVIATYHRLFTKDEANFLLDRGYMVMWDYIEKTTSIIDPYLYFEIGRLNDNKKRNRKAVEEI